MVSVSTLKVTFKKLPFVSFGEVSKKDIQNYLERRLKCSSIFQLHIYVWPDFIHILQPK